MTEENLKKIEMAALSPTDRATAQIRRITFSLAMLVLGFLFAGTPFPLSAYPLGGALVAALPRSPAFAAAGVLLRCVYAQAQGEELWFAGLAALTVCALRYLFGVLLYGRHVLRRGGKIPDDISVRVLLCATTTLAFSLTESILAGISTDGITSMAICTICAAAFTFLLSFFFERGFGDASAATAGLGAFSFCLSLSLVGAEVRGFSIGLLISYMMTLYIGYRDDATKGAATGLLCGLACGGFFAPVFALSGLVAGIFFDVNGMMAALGSFSVIICGALYYGGTAQMTAILPEMAVAAVLITVPCVLRLLPARGSARSAGAAECRELLLRRREEARERKLDSISQSMNALSAVIRGLSEKLRIPESETVREQCVAIWKKHCDTCKNDCKCHDMTTLESEKFSRRLASRLMASDRLNRDKLYEITGMLCPQLAEIATEINGCVAKQMAEALRDDKAKYFAFDYEAAAQMFSDAVSESSLGFRVDKPLSDRLRKAFARAGVRAENLLVCGDRKKYVIATGSEVAVTNLRADELSGLCETVCGTPFCAPSFMLENGKSAVTLESESPFTVEYAGKQSAKKGENVCGDSVSVVRSDDDYFYCFICDGMGSGEEAALTSRVSRVFLEKMLACGNRKGTTLEMLNSFLCAKEGECFATVDLLEVDLMLGIASFVKSGAAPSYIIRGKSLFKIASGTFPVGILPQVSAEATDFELMDGDVILLCSDGVSSDADTGNDGNPTWFVEYLSEGITENLGQMAENILWAAGSAAHRTDDMTVELIRIKRKEGQKEAAIAS